MAAEPVVVEALTKYIEPEKSKGLMATEKFIACHFLEEKHTNGIYEALANRWDRLHSLSAAMRLMEDYGVKLTPEEEQRLIGMEEGQQINALVMKMPQQSNEQFQQFFLQLQLLVSTATRIRRSLEEGRPDHVEDALDEAECTGIAQYILRMAIVQAGSEVAVLREQYLSWLKDVDGRCGRLIRGQEDCRNAQMRLAVAQAQLSTYTAGQNEKAKKVMMNFAAQSDQGLLSGTFQGWKGWVKQEKIEADVRKEYAEQLDSLERQMAQMKEIRLGSIRSMMMRKGIANDSMLLADVLRSWRVEIKEQLDMVNSSDKVKELEEKLNSMRATQMNNTKQVMMRMNADNEYALMGQVFAAFVTHHQDYQKNKDFELKVAESEKVIKNFQASQSEGARKVLQKVGGSTDSGLIQQVFHAWREEWDDAKKEAEMEAIINGQNKKLAALTTRTRDSGMHTLDRGRLILEQGMLLRILGAWRLDTRMEATLRAYHSKIEAKRSQLVGVQQMFRRFATELEGSFRPDTGRDIRDGPPPGRKFSKDNRLDSMWDGKHPSSRKTPLTSGFAKNRMPPDNSPVPHIRDARH